MITTPTPNKAWVSLFFVLILTVNSDATTVEAIRVMREKRRLRAQLFPIYVQQKGGLQPPTQASAQFNILVTGGAGLLPDSGQLFAVETDWILDGGDWLLIRADWESVDLSRLR